MHALSRSCLSSVCVIDGGRIKNVEDAFRGRFDLENQGNGGWYSCSRRSVANK